MRGFCPKGVLSWWVLSSRGGFVLEGFCPTPRTCTYIHTNIHTHVCTSFATNMSMFGYKSDHYIKIPSVYYARLFAHFVCFDACLAILEIV